MFNQNGDNYKKFITLEGEVSSIGMHPENYPLITTDEGTSYTLTGDWNQELESLKNASVKITGGLIKPKHPDTAGNLVVINYNILNPGLDVEKSWAAGLIKYSRAGYVLVGVDQIIYYLENYDEQEMRNNLKDTKAILLGEVEFVDNFTADLAIEGYKVLKYFDKDYE